MSKSAVPAPPALDQGPLPQEPAVKAGSWIAVVTTGIALLVSLGVPISTEVKVALLGFLVAAAPFVTAVIVRAKVYSPESVRLMLRSEKDKRTSGRMSAPGAAGFVGDERRAGGGRV